MQFLKDIFDFTFPRNCIICGRLLNDSEKVICTYCYYEIPRTNFHKDPENPVAKLFWGRIKVEHATAFFYFNKGSRYQKLIHALKYEGRKDIGIEAGKIFGFELKGSVYEQADFLIPVPLHWKKQRKRGYNQSEMIALGMGKALGKPVYTDILERIEFTSSQTRKTRYDRFTNVTGSFIVKNCEKCAGRNILLIDDVVTTGSTVEACAEVLIKNNISKVSLATLAVA